MTGPDFSMSVYLDHLRRSLTSMTQRQRIAVGAMCCDRLLPYYVALADFLEIEDNVTLKRIIERLWDNAEGKAVSGEEEIKHLLEEVKGLRLGEEDCCIFRPSGTQAIGATWSTLEALRSDPVGNVVKAIASPINLVYGEIMALVWQISDGPIGPDRYSWMNRQTDTHPSFLREIRRNAVMLEQVSQRKELSRSDVEYLKKMAAE